MPHVRPKNRYKDASEYRGSGVAAFEWDDQAEMDLLRYFGMQNFWTFFTQVFGAMRNPKGQRWIDPDVHQPLAEWFQMHVDEWLWNRRTTRPQQKHLAVLVHREVGKTTMITQAGQLWLHLRDPEMSSYTGAEKIDHAMKSLGAMKAVLDGSDPYSLFSRFYGNWSGSARTWTGKEIVHSARRNTSRRDPSLGTFAVETSIVGAHPDAIFYDDPISYERLRSDANWFESVKSQVSSLVPVIQSDGLVVWVGTRYGDLDHFGAAFRDEGVRTVSGMDAPGVVPSADGTWHLFFMAGRNEEGEPTTPKVWPEERLRRYQKLDPLRYASQVMNDPQAAQYNPITRDQLEQCWIDPQQVPWSALNYWIHCDHAFSDGVKIANKDETVMSVGGAATNGSGMVYGVEGHGSHAWRGEDLADRIVSTVQRYRSQGKKVVGITNDLPGAGQKGLWRATLRNRFADVNEPMPHLYEFNRGGVKKGDRLVEAAQQWVNGFVRIVKGSPGSKELMEQMASIGQYLINPKTPIDRADAFADAFHPEIYNPKRRQMSHVVPYESGARPIFIGGMSDWEEEQEWLDANPRPPIR